MIDRFRNSAALLLATTLWAVPGASFAVAQSVIIDVELGQDPDAGQSALVANGASVQFRVVNRLPTIDYSLSVRREVIPIPPLDGKGGVLAAGTDCPELIQEADDIKNLPDEIAVKRVVAKLRAQLGKCSKESQAHIQARIDETLYVLPGTFLVSAGEQLIATISRSSPSIRRWTVTVSAGERGRWLTTYGAGFVENGEERFYTRANAAGKFVVTPERIDENGLKPIPGMFFSWLPASRAIRNWSFSPSAGVGVKADRPAVFVGGSVMYNWNLGLVAGVAVSPESRLGGRYEAGQELDETVAESALHRTSYRARPMLAVVFRFGANPFTPAAPAGPAKEAEKKTEDKK